MNKVYLSSELPSSAKVFSVLDTSPKPCLVICDSRLKKNSLLKKWLKNDFFHFYFVTSGENSKSVEKISIHLKKILKLTHQLRQTDIVFISIGGGSIGDLTGFLASIYKRGVPLVHIPTTYLAALDSSHGGKTALNFRNIKNFVGTYWFPEAVFIVKGFFKTLSQKQKESAYGELLKMALIGGGSFYKDVKEYSSKNFSDKLIKQSIFLKMKIVNKDSREKKSIRKVLNLGHTVGHILEAICSLPHGTAVLYGLLFSIEWSFKKGFLNQRYFNEIKSLLPLRPKKISKAHFIKWLRQDKKYKSSKHLDFIFIKKPGSVFVESVSEQEIVREARSQGVI